MPNVTPIEPVNLKNLEDLLEHVCNLSWEVPGSMSFKTSRMIYERDALNNLIGEASCVINEAMQRLKYLEYLLSEEI